MSVQDGVGAAEAVVEVGSVEEDGVSLLGESTIAVEGWMSRLEERPSVVEDGVWTAGSEYAAELPGASVEDGGSAKAVELLDGPSPG